MKHNFPIFENYRKAHGSPLIYFDSASTTQLPQEVIASVANCMTSNHANVHRANYPLGLGAQQLFVDAREQLRSFLGAARPEQIVFTKGCTESINLIAMTIAKQRLNAGDEILISVLEHHANYLPWLSLAKASGATLKVIPLNDDGRLDFSAFTQLINARTRILAMTHVSNVTGEIVDAARFVKQAKAYDCLTVIDGAQAVAHGPVNVSEIDCDFYCFSAHKMYGPQGVGVLYGKTAALNEIPHWFLGGNMVEDFNNSEIFTRALPDRLEAGTPNLAGICGLAEAARFSTLHQASRRSQEMLIKSYLMQSLSKLPLSYLSPSDAPIVAFSLIGGGEQDLCDALASQHIALRSGQHCATPLLRYLGLSTCVRVSLGIYNDEQDIDAFIAATHLFQNQRSAKTSKKVTSRPEPSMSLAGIHSREGFLKHLKEVGRQVNGLKNEEKSEQNAIKECEARSWVSVDNPIPLVIRVDSESTLVRGLLTVCVELVLDYLVKEKAPVTIDELPSLKQHFRHLSKTRQQTVNKLLERINDALI